MSIKHIIKYCLLAVLIPLHAVARTLGIAKPGVAVLMYHGVGDDVWEFAVSLQTLKRQLDMLHRKGFQFISLAEFEQILRGARPMPRRSAFITFDDAYQSVADNALPELRARNIRSALYVHTSRIQEPLGNSCALMLWHTIRESAKFMDIGSHSHKHPVLKELSDAELDDDIQKSIAACHQEVGITPTTFAYPGGKFSERVISALRRHGFTTAFTINQGLVRQNDNHFQLRRIGVTSHTTDLELYAHAVGVGEWYGRIIKLFK
ncbi:MAG: polysaccharide deacetylase family protein [Patescibacteria group bacterium]